MDDETFKGMFRTESIFKNQKTLAQSWAPEIGQKLLCRDDVINKLVLIHRPIIENKGEFSANTLILGSGGIGKTLTTRYFVSRFRDTALKNEVNIKAEYYDCLQVRTKSAVLRAISEKLHYNQGHGYADNEIMQQILLEIKRQNMYLFIILDEIHNIPSEDILALLNASISYGEKNSRFSIICISRPTDWYKVETEKIMSRIQETIRMEPYKHDEAFEILKYRRNLAFRDGALEDADLDLIADIVVETKSMRVGIDIMRSCGLHCDEHKLRQITAEMIREARHDVNPSFRADIIDNLKPQEQLALMAIARTLQNKKIAKTSVEESYPNYCAVCESYGVKPHVAMSFRKYIRNLNAQKAVNTTYLNPTQEKKGRQLEIKLTDITADQLIQHLEQILPNRIGEIDAQDDDQIDENE